MVYSVVVVVVVVVRREEILERTEDRCTSTNSTRDTAQTDEFASEFDELSVRLIQ